MTIEGEEEFDTELDTGGDDDGQDDAGADSDGPEGADDNDADGGHADTELQGDDRGSEHSSDADDAVGRPVSRGQARIEAALADAKAAREEAAAARREIEAERAARGTHADAERERIALENMDPYERANYLSDKNNRQTQARIDQLTFQMADSADRTDFTSKAARIPALAAVAEEVEQALASMRQGGTTAPRETIAKYLLGERALARGAGAKTRAAKAGAARVDRATARPTGTRSDVRADSPRGDTQAARRARLQDVPI